MRLEVERRELVDCFHRHTFDFVVLGIASDNKIDFRRIVFVGI